MKLFKQRKPLLSKKNIHEAIRYSMVGSLVTAIHYGVYLLLQYIINVSIAYTIGYLSAFIVNFFLMAHFTFREKPNWKNGAGFCLAHLCNYLIHITLLTIFLGLGVSKELVPIPIYAIAIPINFMLVRFAFKKKWMKKDGNQNQELI